MAVKVLIATLFCYAVSLGSLATVSAAATNASTTSPPTTYAPPGVYTAGPAAEDRCKQLATTFKAAGLVINNTFSQYFPEGSNPSIQKLSDLYPNGTLPAGIKLGPILDTVGPDANLLQDYGYGKSNTMAARNGETGGLPPFCRFGAFVKTSEFTKVLAEVWMPLEGNFSIPLAPPEPSDDDDSKVNSTKPMSTDSTKGGSSKPPVKRSNGALAKCMQGDDVLGHGNSWNGRLMVSGNGGQRGYVPFPEMKLMMSRYRFATAGSNWGHFSGAGDVAWVNGSQFEDTLLDFGSRANHVALQLAEQVIGSYYGPSVGIRDQKKGGRLRRFYMGSSTGGARGLSAMSVYPEDFDGVLAGAPATNFMSMNTGQLHTASLANPNVTINGTFDAGVLYGPIKDIVTTQCDMLDGVADRIISDPFRCRPDITKDILCNGTGKYSKDKLACLNQTQIDTYHKLFDDTYLDGHLVYPHYLPGLEDSASSFNPTNAKASGWHQLVVLKQPKLDPKFDPFHNITYADLERGIAADPGGVNAQATDYSRYFEAGGKTIMYQGSYDLVVSPLNTIHQLEAIIAQSGGEAAKHAIKFYLVPGMRHSRGGPGAWHMGAAAQTGPGWRPLMYDTNHDLILALVAWVEHGLEPQAQIAAAYHYKELLDDSEDSPTSKTKASQGGSTAPSDAKQANDTLPIVDIEQRYGYGVNYTRLICPWPQLPRYQGGSTSGDAGYLAFTCA